VHFADLVVDAGVVEDALGRRRLAGVLRDMKSSGCVAPVASRRLVDGSTESERG